MRVVPNSSISSISSRPLWSEWLIWAGVAACAIGFVLQQLWQVLPWGRFGEALALAGLSALLAWPLQRWRRWAWSDALALVWLVALAALTGVVPALAVAALAATALAIGSLLSSTNQPLIALLSGLALLAGGLGWALPLPVHQTWAYWLVCIVVLWLRRHVVRTCAIALYEGWRQAVSSAPRAAAWSVLAIGLASSGAWLPTMQFDDLAYHLGLPWQLMLNGRYALEPSHQVWALAPWAGDVLQGFAQVLAHAEARSALNLVWLVTAAAGMWQLTGTLGGNVAMRWAAVALYASLPLTAALLGGMQTETPATAATLALAVLVLRDVGIARRDVLSAGLLFGLLFALKPLHGVAALPLLLWGLWRHRASLCFGDVLLVVLLAVGVAASSYVYAWLISGNPVLPLLNGVFHSPYMPSSSFNDPRWQQGVSLALPWQLTFSTERYLEGWNGGFGFVLIALLGAGVVAVRHSHTRGLALCAGLAITLPLLPLQYARYLHPGLALLIPALVTAAAQVMPARRAAVLIALICGANFAFQANSHWFPHTGASKRSLATLGRDADLFARYAPERALIAAIRAHTPKHSLVLVLDKASPVYAELAGRGRTTAWYDPKLQAASEHADADGSGTAWAELLQREAISEVILRPATLTPAQRVGLHRLRARREAVIGEAEWWRIDREASQ